MQTTRLGHRARRSEELMQLGLVLARVQNWKRWKHGSLSRLLLMVWSPGTQSLNDSVEGLHEGVEDLHDGVEAHGTQLASLHGASQMQSGMLQQGI